MRRVRSDIRNPTGSAAVRARREAERGLKSKGGNIASWCFIGLSLVLFGLTGCGNSSSSATPASTGSNVFPPQVPSNVKPSTGANMSTGEIPVYTYEVINVFPHDRAAFTQGLLFQDGALLESTGLYGQSS